MINIQNGIQMICIKDFSPASVTLGKLSVNTYIV